MTSVASSDLVGDFDLFYEAHFGDTVAMTYGFTADLGEAQDIAQEAFCRAWLRWREVSTYDNPVAWVRRVATNLAHSRWRRLRVAASHLVRQREPEPMPAVNPDHVAVVAALRKLPITQRRAVVLHHLMDMPVTEVAEQLEVPVGTVKSWLHRARAALADDLRVDVRGAVSTPPTQEVLDRADKRKRARIATAASALILVLLGGLAGLRFVRMEGPPAPPTGSPTPAPTLSPTVDPMRTVNWGSATIHIGEVVRDGCPEGNVTFALDKDNVAGGPAGGKARAYFRPSQVALGDLTGDGLAEAALTVSCEANPEAGGDSVPAVLIVENVRGDLVALAWVGRPSSMIANVWIADGVLYVDHRPHESSRAWVYKFGEVSGWRLDGMRFTAVDTTDRYPIVAKLDITAVETKLKCSRKNPAPTTTPGLSNKDGVGFDWDMKAIPPGPIYAAFDRPGRPYLVVRIGCSADLALVVFDLVAGRWVAVTSMQLPNTDPFMLFSDSPGGVLLEPQDGKRQPMEYGLVNGQLVPVGPPSPASSASGATRTPG